MHEKWMEVKKGSLTVRVSLEGEEGGFRKFVIPISYLYHPPPLQAAPRGRAGGLRLSLAGPAQVAMLRRRLPPPLSVHRQRVFFIVVIVVAPQPWRCRRRPLLLFVLVLRHTCFSF
ncbi:auxin-responsive protein SAUR32-like [Canna indica]|uniref:Auxin-responsive protein SAUR32-like n=1 Tax=Canna indica TaxID=4628 RepID=A0AAQ3JWX6_9LILI|nr:auxin-responsive protein SAUR32-like [Canna indica]